MNQNNKSEVIINRFSLIIFVKINILFFTE